MMLSGKKSFCMIALFCLLLVMVFSRTVYVSASETKESYPLVYDKAGLLSTSEAEDLETLCRERGKEVGIDIMILTHDDPDAVDAKTYIEDFYDSLPEPTDRVILLIDMANRVSFIEGYGLAKTYIHNDRIDEIIQEIRTPLSDQDYYKAFEKYIELSADYMTDDSVNAVSNYETHADYSSNSVDRLLRTWWFQLLVSLVLGGIIVGIMAYNSSGRMTAGSSTYLDTDHSGLIGRRDQYIRTELTRVRKPENNSSNGGMSGGGFDGGVSSGGNSHSSGGGSF